MRSNSIKEALPRLTRLMILILIALILPANIYIQLFLQHENQKESSKEMFGQLKQLIRTNENTIEKTKKDFSAKCIRAAGAVEYFVRHSSEMVTDIEHTKLLAEKLGVDEIHFFTEEGEIFAGTHPEYYGYTFDSGEQMNFFKPMLNDRSLKLCQEITANTAEGKKMQYAAVWAKDGSMIVQIGMEPVRVAQEIKENSPENILSTFPTDFQGYLHIIEKKSGIITASTAENIIGKNVSSNAAKNDKTSKEEVTHYKWDGVKYCVYTEPYKDYLLVRTYVSSYLLKQSIESTALVLLYIVIAAAAVISIIGWYVNKKLANNLMFIVSDLTKIEKGNLDNITISTGIMEFDELIHYINEMLKSIRLNWNKLSYMMDKGSIPLGVFEENTFYKKQFINERMIEIFGIEGSNQIEQSELAQIVKSRLDLARQTCLDSAENIYEYDRDGKKLQLNIECVKDGQSETYYVTDMSQWWSEIHELRRQSSSDILTGLYNRRGFRERMEQIFKEPSRIGAAAIVMLDADGLKNINDFCGHHIGDKYLQQIGKFLEETVKDHGISARLGGDEFVAFLYGFHSEEEIIAKLEAMKRRRGEKLDLGKTEKTITMEFSVGYVCCSDDYIDYHNLMRIADERMYKEKNERKGRA